MHIPSNQDDPNFYEVPSGAGSKHDAGRPLPGSRPFTIWEAMLLIVAVAVVIRLVMPAGPAVAALLLVVTVLAGITGGIAMFFRNRSVRSEPMLRVVSNAVEHNLPLEPGIEACGALCGGSTRRRSRAVVGLMERGLPMAEAFARVPGSFPRSGLVYLRMGWDGPVLAGALRALIRRQSAYQPFRSLIGARLTYLIWTLFAMQVVVFYMMYWIAPKLEAISMDFGVELPSVTRWTFWASSHAAFEPIMAGLFLLQLIALPLFSLIFFDPMDWGIASVDRLFLKRHGATVLRALAGEVALNRPLPKSFERIAQAHPSRVVRRRLRWVNAHINQGRPWVGTLAASGLIRRSDAAVLDAAERAGNLSWALNDLADGLDRRFGYRLMVWTQLLYPVAVIAIAVPVAVFVATYFLPLVTLIQAMAE